MHSIQKSGEYTLLSVAALTIMVGSVLLPGLLTISRHLGVLKDASWLVTMPSLGVVLFAPLAGKFIQKVGFYVALSIGLFLYGALGLLGMWLHGPTIVFLDRLLLGGATAIVMSAGTGLISVFYQDTARLVMIAKQGMSIELGGVLFLFVGGLLAEAHWQFPFLLYLVAWILLVAMLMFVPHPPLLNASNEQQVPTDNTSTRSLTRVYLAALASMFIFFICIISLPIKLHMLGFTESKTGYFLSFISLVAVLAASLMPKIMRKLSEYKTLSLAFLFYGLGHLTFFSVSQTPILIVGAILIGFGFGLSIPLVNHMTVDQSQPAARAKNLAYLSMAIFFGQVLSSFMTYLPWDHRFIFLASACISCLLIVSLWATSK